MNINNFTSWEEYIHNKFCIANTAKLNPFQVRELKKILLTVLPSLKDNKPVREIIWRYILITFPAINAHLLYLKESNKSDLQISTMPVLNTFIL